MPQPPVPKLPPPKFVVLCGLDHDELDLVESETPAALKKRADKVAADSGATILGIWTTNSPDASLIAVVSADNAQKARAFLGAFSDSSLTSVSAQVLKIRPKSTKKLLEAFTHTKM